MLVVDSCSSDATEEVARDLGADVVPFEWNGAYPKKKQWSIDYAVEHFDPRWIMLLDADERVTKQAASFLQSVAHAESTSTVVAYRFAIEYRFGGGQNTHGFQARKIALFRPEQVHFAPQDDLDLPNGWEVEGHYQPVVDGEVATAPVPLVHDDEDHLHDWFHRHNRYSDWEAHLRFRRARVEEDATSLRTTKRLFERLPFQGVVAFAHSYVFKRGFLDGSAGFDFAVARGVYYWLSAAKLRELRRRERRR